MVDVHCTFIFIWGTNSYIWLNTIRYKIQTCSWALLLTSILTKLHTTSIGWHGWQSPWESWPFSSVSLAIPGLAAVIFMWTEFVSNLALSKGAFTKNCSGGGHWWEIIICKKNFQDPFCSIKINSGTPSVETQQFETPPLPPYMPFPEIKFMHSS